MREIKFRGKSTSSCEIANEGDWIYGNLVIDGDQAYIVNGVTECNYEYIAIEEWCPVDPNTVGQYVGLKDRLGVEIYEGDIMGSSSIRAFTYKTKIVWDAISAKFYAVRFTGSKEGQRSIGFIASRCKVTGNIYDNPELLK